MFLPDSVEQESTHYFTVCLTVPVTTEEKEPCLTSYGIVHESHEAMTDHWAAEPVDNRLTATQEHV